MATYHHVNVREALRPRSGIKPFAIILLLHGFPSSSHMFRDPIPQLSDKFHAIAQDYVAMPPGVQEFEYTLDNLAAHVEDVFANRHTGRTSICISAMLRE